MNSSRRKMAAGILIAAGVLALLVPFLFKGSVLPVSPVDQSPPSTNIVLNGIRANSGWYVSAVNITLSAHDSKGMGSIHYKMDGGTETTFASGQGTDISVNLAPVSVEGSHVIQYWSIDKAGNVEKAKSASFQVDTSAPMVSFDMKDKYYQTETVMIVFSASDFQSEVVSNATLDIGTPTARTVAEGDQIPAISLANGPHTLTVQASDAAGNTSTMSKTFRVEKLHDSIIDYLNGGQIDNAGVGNSLLVKADHALARIGSGNMNAGLNQLRALENHLTAQSGQHIDSSSATDIMNITDAIMQSVPPTW